MSESENEAVDENQSTELIAKDQDENTAFSKLEDLLKFCKLESLLSVFIQQEIDDEFLLAIDVSSSEEWNQISQLLPTIGAKGKFRKALKEYQVGKQSMANAILF